MSSPQVNVNATAVLALVAVAGGAYLAWRYLPKLTVAGAGQAAQQAGAAVVNAGAAVVNGAVTGAVGAAGAAVGLPTPDETTTDPRVARWLIDRLGYFEASKWASAGALVRGAMMDAGTGTPPPAATALAAYVAQYGSAGDAYTQPTTGDFARMDRATYVDPDTIPQPATFSDGVNRDPALDFLPQGYLYAGTF